MMKKNRITKILTFVFALSMFVNVFSINAFAAKSVDIRQINSSLPNVKFELEGKFDEKDIESVKIDGEAFTVKDAHKASSSDKKLVYYLIDTSTSMSQQALNAIKPSLISYADSLGEDDKLVLMTFGTNVKTVLKGNESKSKIHSAINSIRCNSDGTTFYKALIKALDDSVDKKGYDRKYAIVVSDGADFEKGNSSQQEVIDELETNRLPVYGLCLSSTDKSNADGFGYITRTSGGTLTSFSSSDASSKFKSVKKTINNVTIVKAESNIGKSLGTCDIKVKAKKNSSSYIAEDKILADAKNDEDNPEVKDISFDKDSNSFVIKFSENVEKADNISSFTVKKGKNDLAIVTAKYSSKDCTVKLNMNDKVYSGKYTFEFRNITDASDNKNPLKNKSIEKDVDAFNIIYKILIIVGFALIPIAFLVALYLILMNIKKKKNVTKIKDIFVQQEEVIESEQVHIEQAQGGKKLRIHIQSGDGTVHNVSYNMYNSMIVGRSDMCDLTVQDPVLSRQHFVVEEVENGLAICDLETTNGTFVNGVQIKSKTFLDSEATISAGNSIIRIAY